MNEVKIKELAYKAYPNNDTPGDRDTIFDDWEAMRFIREAFVDGFKQAEEYYSLTIEDIEKLHVFLYATKHNKSGAFTFTRLSDEQYEQVLRMFNALKE